MAGLGGQYARPVLSLWPSPVPSPEGLEGLGAKCSHFQGGVGPMLEFGNQESWTRDGLQPGAMGFSELVAIFKNNKL